MGVGVSSLRLRKAVVLRAYNLRQGDETLEEQFRKYAFRGVDGRLYISLIEVKECLRFAELTWADEMLKRLMGESVVSDLLFADFVEFLETGRQPTLRTSSSESNIAPQTDLDESSDRLSRSQSASGPLESTAAKKADKGTAGRGERAPVPGRRSRSKDLPPHPPQQQQQQQQQQLGVGVGVAELDPLEKAPDLELVIHPKDSAFARLSPSSSVWRKREIVRQERTVQYTTIDADGLLQELVEKETSETEVLHMESRETGEFAHRETTVYEQKETFNDEVVAEQHGSEEYVHLKSLEDEFEYMESTMPNKNGANAEGAGAGAGDEGRPPISPRPAEGGEGGEGGGDGGDGGGFWSSHEQGPVEGGHGFEYSEEGLGLDEDALAFLRYQEQQREFERHGQRRGGDAGEGQEDQDQDLELELEMEMMEQMLKQQQQHQQYRGGEDAEGNAGVREQGEILANWMEPGLTSRPSGAEQVEEMRDQGLEVEVGVEVGVGVGVGVGVEVSAPEVHPPPPSSSSSSSSSFVDID